MLRCSIWFPVTVTIVDFPKQANRSATGHVSRMPPSNGREGPMEGSGSIYFRSFNSSFAASSDDAGFWPVTSLPSTTT